MLNAGDQPVEGDVHAATLQFVRKISGYGRSSRANSDILESAPGEITAASLKMLASLRLRVSASARRD